MYHQSPYVDANSHYVGVAKSSNGHVMSANPNEQRPTRYSIGEAWNLHNHDMQLMDPNFRASATPFNMPVNNTMSLSDQYRTPHVQEGVSQFYPSAASSQYAGSSPNMPMNGGIGHAFISNLAGYPQSSYTAPYEINQSMPYATSDIHDSAHFNYGRVYEFSTGACVPNITADSTSRTSLQNFGDTRVSLPKESKSIGGQFYPDWVINKNLMSFWDECNVVRLELIKEGKHVDSAAIQARLCQKEKALRVDRIIRKSDDSDNKVNSVIEKAESDIICAESTKEKDVLPISRTNETKDDSSDESTSVEKAESNNIYSESIKSKEASIVEKGHGKFLPYDFRAIEVDEHQEQSNMIEHSLVNDEHQEQEHAAKQSSADEERPSGIHSGNLSEIYSGNPSDEARDPEEEAEALEDHLGAEQSIVPRVRSSYSTNVVAKIFGGVGIACLPLSLIFSFVRRPKAVITRSQYIKEATELGKKAKELKKAAEALHQEERSGNKGRKWRKNVKAVEKELLLLENDMNALEEMYPQGEKAEATWAFTVLAYIGKLIFGVVGLIISIAWVAHIIIYLLVDPPLSSFLNEIFIKLDSVWGLLGTAAFAFFCFYLLIAVIAGEMMLGLKLVFITIHPMKWGGTLMNSFLFNVGLILLCSISVIQFCATAFAYYAQATAAQEIFGHTLQSLRGIKYLYKYNVFQYGFVAFAILTLFYYALFGWRKRKPTGRFQLSN